MIKKMIQNYLQMIKIDQKNPVNDQKIIFRDIFQLSKYGKSILPKKNLFNTGEKNY